MTESCQKHSNHRQFKEFLNEIDTQYSYLLLHNTVRWLSTGKVLKRFALCLNEINTFLNEKGINHPELENDIVAKILLYGGNHSEIK